MSLWELFLSALICAGVQGRELYDCLHWICVGLEGDLVIRYGIVPGFPLTDGFEAWFNRLLV
jgi:hypothetical protein